MEEAEAWPKIEYNLCDINDNRYIATLIRSIKPGSKEDKDYSVGAMIPVPDCFINKNNCRKLRECIIQRITPNPGIKNKYVVHVKPTTKEFLPENIVNLGDYKNRSGDYEPRGDTDWDGLDGYLRPPN
jgi:hypothetical protein